MRRVSLEDEAAVQLAARSRGTPRLANRMLKRARDYAQVRFDGNVTVDVARQALDLLDVDNRGLDATDRQLLKTMITVFGG